MKDLYNIISESLFDEEDQLDSIDAKIWLDKQDPTTVRGEIKNGKIELEIFRNIGSTEDIIVPDGIKFGNVESLQLYSNNSNYDYSKIPAIDKVNDCIIRPAYEFRQVVDMDLSDLKVKNIRILLADTTQTNYISFPQCPVELAHIGRTWGCTDREYVEDWGRSKFNIESLKSLNTKKLIIGDLLITEDSLQFKHFYHEKFIPKDWPEYTKIEQFMKYNKNLYIMHDGHGGDRKYHKVKKVQDGFIVSKMGFTIK